MQSGNGTAPAVPRDGANKMIPGARERTGLTRFAVPGLAPVIPEGPSSMDAATTAERQREGGGSPKERRG